MDVRLPAPTRLSRCRSDWLPFHVFSRQPNGGREASSHARARRRPSDQRHALRQADGRSGDLAPHAISEPALHRPGSPITGTSALGRAGFGLGSDRRHAFHTKHPFFVEDKVRLFVDPWPWFEALRTADFAFGSRIHGNIAALVAGTPSYVLAHDSRTLELARYFEIPHRRMDDFPAGTDAAELYAEADYSALNQGQPARFATFTRFLTRHGLGHVFAEGEDPDWFDRRAAETNYPPGVGALRDPRARALGRLKRLNYQMRGSAQSGWNRAPSAARTRVTTAARSQVR